VRARQKRYVYAFYERHGAAKAGRLRRAVKTVAF